MTPIPPVARHAELTDIADIAIVSNHPDRQTAQRELTCIYADLPEGAYAHSDSPLLHCHERCWIPTTVAVNAAVGVWHGRRERDENA